MTRTIKILVTLICLTAAMATYGQSKKENRKNSYSKFKSRSSSERSAGDLLDDAKRLKEKDPNDALDKVEEALGVSLVQGDEFSEGRSYELLGEINEGIGEWKLALENYSKAYDKLKSFPDKNEFQQTLRGLAASHSQLGQYNDALKFLAEALALPLSDSERNNRLIEQSDVYYKMGKYDEALASLTTVPSSNKTGKPEPRVQSQQAKIYARQNQLAKSTDVFSNTLNSLRSNPPGAEKAQEQAVQDTKDEIAGALRGQQKYDEEIDLRNLSIGYNTENKNFSEVTRDKVEIGKSLSAKGDNNAALLALEEASRMADTLDDPRQQAGAYLALADQYEKNGRSSQALAAYRKYSLAVAKKEKAVEARLAEKSVIITKQQDIDELSKSISLGQQQDIIAGAIVFRQQLVIYGLLFIILIIVVTSYFIYKNAQASKIANQLLALKSLRGQMNPHFIFNALNSVNHFITQQDERTANKFLSEFSQLMRWVLENSQEDFITLEREQEILGLYLKLEHYRFRDKFIYEIETEEGIHAESIELPPMLIQPYIENAVWHGLRYRDGMGKLTLRFRKEDKNVVVEVIDDGIGRSRSAELKTANQKKHQSTGLKNIQERLSIINRVYKANYQVRIDDLENGTGTRVLLYLPIEHRNRKT